MFYNLTKRRIGNLKLILLLGLVIILSLVIVPAPWFANLNNDLIYYYALNESSGTNAEEEVNGVVNITVDAASWVDGIIGNGFNFTNTGNMDTGINLTTFSNNFTFNFWINKTATIANGQRMWDAGTSDLLVRATTDSGGLNSIDFFFNNTGVGDDKIPLATNRWYMFTMTRNTTAASLWVNGTLNGTLEIDNHEFIGAALCLASGGAGCGAETRIRNMIIDEIGLWNRTLDAGEILELYNNGNGITYNPNALNRSGLVVTLNSPVDDVVLIESTIEFNSTLSPIGTNLTNVTLFLFNSTGDVFNETTNIVTGNTTNTTSFTVTDITLGNYEWNSFGCGINVSNSTLCSFAISNSTFTSGFSINNITFNSPVSEGSQQIFSLNLTYDLTTHNLGPRFHYNNTVFNPSISVIGGDTILSNQFIVPGLLNNVNLTFFWDLDFTDIDTSSVFSFNTTENNQSVLILNMDDCSVFTNEILNFTMVNEETQVQLAGSVDTNDTTDMDVAVNIFDSLRESVVLELSNNFTINPVRICLESALLNESDYSLDVIVNYEVKGAYANEYYNIVNATLDSDYTAREITLFDLNISDSTPFQLTFTGEDYLPEGDVLVNVNRQYIGENVFKTVELPITDIDGKTILNLVRNDVIYNLRMIKNGQLIGNFERIRAFCEDPLLQNCQITLAASPTIDEFTYDAITDLIYSSLPIYDSNASTVTFDFITASGLSKTVNLNVTRSDIFGNRTICENSLTSASGTLICSIDPGITDTRLITGVSVDGITVILSSIRVNVSDFGTVGYVAWFIITLILIFAFGDTKSGVLISLLVSYVGAAILGINRATILGIGSAGIWIIVITVLGLWRLNRDKIQ